MRLADLVWLFVVAWLVTLAWMLAYTVGIWLQLITMMVGSDNKAWRYLARAHKELWPFAPIGMLQDVVVSPDTYNGWTATGLALSLGIWWWSRAWPDSDSPWTRRRKKTTAQVKAVAGRLVVAPREA